MKSVFIVSLLLKDGNNQQKREKGGLWRVIEATLLYVEKTAIFAAYTSLVRMDQLQKILIQYQLQQVD
jgi:hypothetical protein